MTFYFYFLLIYLFTFFIYFYLFFEVHVFRSNTWDRFFWRNRRPPSHAQRLCSFKANQTAWLNARTWGCGAAVVPVLLGTPRATPVVFRSLGAAFMMFRGLCVPFNLTQSDLVRFIQSSILRPWTTSLVPWYRFYCESGLLIKCYLGKSARKRRQYWRKTKVR